MAPHATPLLVIGALALGAFGCADFGESLYLQDRDQARAALGLLPKVARVDDHDIVHFDRGEGEVVLLVHGFGGSKDSWLSMLPHLPEDARYIIPDLPGMGGASTFDDDVTYGFAKYAGFVHGLLDALDVERAHVVGVSFGGAVATRVAATYPERTTSLTAIAPAGVTPPAPSAFQRRWAEGVNELIVRSEEDYDKSLALLLDEPPSFPPGVKEYLVADSIAAADRLTKIDDDVREDPHLEPLLGDITSSTRVIWGTRDRILDPSGAEVFEDEVAGAEIVLLDECGHACTYTHPEETAARVVEHVR